MKTKLLKIVRDRFRVELVVKACVHDENEKSWLNGGYKYKVTDEDGGYLYHTQYYKTLSKANKSVMKRVSESFPHARRQTGKYKTVWGGIKMKWQSKFWMKVGSILESETLWVGALIIFTAIFMAHVK